MTVQTPMQDAVAFGRRLSQQGRIGDGEQWSARAVEAFPDSFDIWNLRGVFLRRLGRPSEALAAFERALTLKPDLFSARANRAGLMLDLGEFDRAGSAYLDLVAAEPHPALPAPMAFALVRAGRADEAVAALGRLTEQQPGLVEGWVQHAETLAGQGRHDEALAVAEAGLAIHPTAVSLMQSKSVRLRDVGRSAAAERYLEDLMARLPAEAWVPFHLADLVWEADRTRGFELLRSALRLAPDDLDHLIGLIQALERTQDAREGAHLDEAHALALRALALKPTSPQHTKVLRDLFVRTASFAALARLGSFADLGRGWARAGLHTALLKQMAQVRSDADRVELLAQHRLWAEAVEAKAARTPIRRPFPEARSRIRLGIMSSDLRRHVVSFFAQPLFDHIDHDRFEVFAYSFARGNGDEVQARIAGQVSAFRWRQDLTDQAAAQMIADDGLDFLVELGGSTDMNRLEVMAYRPAPLQASWLGYPHSTGLSAIDYFICDQHNRPTRPDLFRETPLLVPESWISLGGAFTEADEILPATPEDRNGVLTFGTANNPMKFTAEGLGAWARILARTPGSRFAFVRPEAGSAAFRHNVLAAFAAEGVAPDRIVFHAVRGDHMRWYNEIDIALDPFPLTGGTTTAESLWMGVPVVSLAGEAFFERISHSILCNAGLADLCAFDPEGYVEIAVALAGDPERRRALRSGLRQRIRGSALGQPALFARRFYDAIEAAVRGG